MSFTKEMKSSLCLEKIDLNGKQMVQTNYLPNSVKLFVISLIFVIFLDMDHNLVLLSHHSDMITK